MANGISVKQAIENELDGKDAYTINDAIKCIKHIANGIDNLPVAKCQTRLTNLETEMKFHKRFLSAVWGLTGGTIVIIGQYIYQKLKGN